MTMINMKDQTIGVEIEMTGITRKQVAEITAEHTNGQAQRKSNGGWIVTGADGRKWDIKYDGSIKAKKRPAPGRKMQPVGYGESQEWAPELATPILTYDDIPMLQELVRKLFKAGGRSSADLGCGMHIHIGADKHDARSLRNLVNIIASKQNLLYTAAQVDWNRESGYAAKTRANLVEQLNQQKPTAVNGLGNTIQGILSATGTDRYHGLNLQAIWKIGTVEWRLFNGTMHAGEIKAYIQLALAISAQAINQRSASPTETTTTNPAFTFRTWLIRLGLNGDEFKTARQHLLKHLPGDKAWRHAA
jgi:hypothetical protein